MGVSASAASSVVVPDLASAASAAAKSGTGISSQHLDRSGIGVLAFGYSRHQDPVAAALAQQPQPGIPERLPQTADLLRSTSGKDAQHAGG